MRYFLINTSLITKNIEEHIKKYYPIRYSYALKYKNHNDYLTCIGAYYLLEKAIGSFDETKIQYGKNGKPYLIDYPNFNYSHSGEFIALVVSKKHDVGIDIQIIGDKDRKFIKEWTKKEAVFKLTGEGIKLHSPLPTKYKNKKIKVFIKKATKDFILSVAFI